MKTLILGLLATAALATALPVVAQPGPGQRPPGADRPYGGPGGDRGGDRGDRGDRRDDFDAGRSQFSDDFRRIHEDIQRGERDRRLSHFDANRFDDELKLIQHDVRDFLRDDHHMSRTQEKKTRARLDRLNNLIRDASRGGRR